MERNGVGVSSRNGVMFTYPRLILLASSLSVNLELLRIWKKVKRSMVVLCCVPPNVLS